MFKKDNDAVQAYLDNCKKYEVTPTKEVLIALQIGHPTLTVPSDASLLPLATILSENKTIKKLTIQCVKMKYNWNSNCLVLREICRDNITIEELELSGIGIDEIGVEQLAIGLRENKTVKRVDLSRNYLGPEGAIVLFTILRESTTLDKLDVSFNAIGWGVTKMMKRDMCCQNISTDGNYVLEEIYNAVSHGLGLIFSLIAGGLLIHVTHQRGSGRLIFGVWIYSVSLWMVFSSSMMYHSLFMLRRSQMVLQVLDHCSIFMTIAGTTTPIMLFYDKLAYREICILGWILCVLGITTQILLLHSDKKHVKYFQTFEIILSVSMAAVPFLLAGRELHADFPGTGEAMFLGCLVYLAGIPFFVLDPWVPVFHTLWHLFVGIASVIHWFAIWDLINTLPRDGGMVSMSMVTTATNLITGVPHQEL